MWIPYQTLVFGPYFHTGLFSIMGGTPWPFFYTVWISSKRPTFDTGYTKKKWASKKRYEFFSGISVSNVGLFDEIHPRKEKMMVIFHFLKFTGCQNQFAGPRKHDFWHQDTCFGYRHPKMLWKEVKNSVFWHRFVTILNWCYSRSHKLKYRVEQLTRCFEIR